MRILYVYQYDANDAAIQSGRPASIYRILEENGHQVHKLILDTNISRLLRLFHKCLLLVRFVRTTSIRSDLLAFYYSRKIRGALTKGKFDVVFSPSTIPFQIRFIDKFNVGILKVACVDTLLTGFKQYYGYRTSTYDADRKREAKSLENIDALFVPSNWAEKQAKDLNFNGKIYVAPFGANNCSDFSESQVRRAITDRISAFPRINILTVMADWDRKNGDLLAQLIESLMPVLSHITLTVIGEAKGVKRELIEKTQGLSLNMVGYIAPNSPQGKRQIATLFTEASFFAMPSKGEAFGMALCEAASYGLPMIGSRNGGIADIVKESETGVNLTSLTDIPLVRSYIIKCVTCLDFYAEQSLAAFADYRDRLNWQKFYQQTFQRLGVR